MLMLAPRPLDQRRTAPCAGEARKHDITAGPDCPGAISVALALTQAILIKIIKLAILRPLEECGHLGPAVDQGRPRRVAGVTDSDHAARQLGELDAAPAGVAEPALPPAGYELISHNAIFDWHGFSSSARGHHEICRRAHAALRAQPSA